MSVFQLDENMKTYLDMILHFFFVIYCKHEFCFLAGVRHLKVIRDMVSQAPQKETARYQLWQIQWGTSMAALVRYYTKVWIDQKPVLDHQNSQMTKFLHSEFLYIPLYSRKCMFMYKYFSMSPSFKFIEHQSHHFIHAYPGDLQQYTLCLWLKKKHNWDNMNWINTIERSKHNRINLFLIQGWIIQQKHTEHLPWFQVWCKHPRKLNQLYH